MEAAAERGSGRTGKRSPPSFQYAHQVLKHLIQIPRVHVARKYVDLQQKRKTKNLDLKSAPSLEN